MVLMLGDLTYMCQGAQVTQVKHFGLKQGLRLDMISYSEWYMQMKHKRVIRFVFWNKVNMAWIRMVKDVRTNNLRTLKDILMVNF